MDSPLISTSACFLAISRQYVFWFVGRLPMQRTRSFKFGLKLQISNRDKKRPSCTKRCHRIPLHTRGSGLPSKLTGSQVFAEYYIQGFTISLIKPLVEGTVFWEDDEIKFRQD